MMVLDNFVSCSVTRNKSNHLLKHAVFQEADVFSGGNWP